MPSVPISIQNANKPGGPVILGSNGKIPSSVMPSGSGGGGGGCSVQPLVIRCTDDNMRTTSDGTKYHWPSPYSYRDILAAFSSGVPVLIYADFHIQEEYDNKRFVLKSAFNLTIENSYNVDGSDEYLELGEWMGSTVILTDISFDYWTTPSIDNLNFLSSNMIYNAKLEPFYTDLGENYIYVDSEEDVFDTYPVFYYYLD